MSNPFNLKSTQKDLSEKKEKAAVKNNKIVL